MAEEPTNAQRRRWGRQGGLVAWSRHPASTLLGPAWAGQLRRFERQVDPDNLLPPAERRARAERARKAALLAMAERSAAVRRARKAQP